MASSTPRDAFVTVRSGQRREVSFRNPSVTNVAWIDDLVDSQSEERVFVRGGSRYMAHYVARSLTAASLSNVSLR